MGDISGNIMVVEKVDDTATTASGVPFAFIGDLALRLGLSPVTIRFYEKEGLISPHRIGRFRTYGTEEEAQLRAIKEMRRMGFPISRMRQALSLIGAQQDSYRQESLKTILETHLSELQSRAVQIEHEIRATHDKLQSLEENAGALAS